MSLVEKIQNLCNENNLTLYGLEKNLGFSHGSIRLWDKNSPSIDKVKKAAEYFKVSLDYLYDVDAPSEIKAMNNTERKILLIARKSADLPEEKRNAIIRNFEDNIDFYANLLNNKNKED